MTKTQIRALLLLPSGGTWACDFGVNSPAVRSLALYYRKLCETDWRDAGPRGGRKLCARLTPMGIEEQARQLRQVKP